MPFVVTVHDVYLQRRHLTGNSIVDYAQNMYGLGALVLRWMLSQVQQTLYSGGSTAAPFSSSVATRRIGAR